jgi:hypothetical protein
MTRVYLFALGASAIERNSIANSINAAQRGQKSSPSCAPFPSRGLPTPGRALVTTQGALAAPLQRIDLEWLL